MNERFDELKTRLAEIHDVRRAQEVLFWDQTVMMPPGGGPVRGEQLTTLDRIAHSRFIDDETGRLLDELQSYEDSLDYDSDEASLLRTTRRDWSKARRVPAELAAEMVMAAAEGHDIWAKAREEDDYASFMPHLEKTIELKRRYVDCFEGYDEPYDVLLDDYEPGMKTAEVRTVFDELKAELVPLIAEVGSTEPEEEFMSGPFPIDAQHAFSLRVIERFGYDPQFFRLDLTIHPFAASSGTQDIRLTTRYKDDDITSVFTAMHECGHGLYEHGVSQSLERTPLCHGVSSALHESQSRLWENIVGRSRPFWNHFYPQLQESFPQALGDVEQERFYRAINRVRPSYIRVDADEATYNLHIILRFELEQELMAGKIALRELPEIWNARFEEYLGIPFPTTGSASSRTSTGRAAASATSRRTRSATSSRCRSGTRSRPRSRTSTTSSSGVSSGRCTTGSARTSTPSGASSRRRRRSSASSAGRSTRSPTAATCARSSARSRPRRRPTTPDDRVARSAPPGQPVERVSRSRLARTARRSGRAPSPPRPRGRAATRPSAARRAAGGSPP